MKLIGISSSTDNEKNRIFLNEAYSRAFTREGITPLIIPTLSVDNRELMGVESFYLENKSRFEAIANKLDALVVSGGVDINPVNYPDEEINAASYLCDSIRDYTEIALINSFIKAKKPIMGICRGFQLIGKCLALENFQQDLSNLPEVHSGTERSFSHRQETCHSVNLFRGLKDYINLPSINVNSWHHQGFTFTPTGKISTNPTKWAAATDEYEQTNKIEILACTTSVLEGFMKEDEKIVAVQWHPEEYGPTGKTIQFFIDKFLK